MPSDMLRAPRSMGSKYVMRKKGSEKYISKIIESEKIWSTIVILKWESLYGI